MASSVALAFWEEHLRNNPWNLSHIFWWTGLAPYQSAKLQNTPLSHSGISYFTWNRTMLKL